MSTYTLTREINSSHFGSCFAYVSDEDQDTVGVDGEVPHEIGTLNAYIYFFQLSVPLIYVFI